LTARPLAASRRLIVGTVTTPIVSAVAGVAAAIASVSVAASARGSGVRRLGGSAAEACGLAVGFAALALARLPSGADPNVATLYARATPLHYAALAGWHEAVGALVSAGARVDARDGAGRTALELVEAQAAAMAAAARGGQPPPAIDVRVAAGVRSAMQRGAGGGGASGRAGPASDA